ncbi:hypothetical protein [Massilia sp. Se16.2.3]|uniref:hypothetical protein n=1 Tax=Massilia sp. Se16.2.3 TaxID=2709303 RepID=UPI00280629AA|nr:hypothetical protein [Massilia sp. Se16.2.3]
MRIFGSESVVVVDAAGAIVSEAASERRLHTGRGQANRLGAVTADYSVRPAMPPKAAIDAAVAATKPGRQPRGTAERGTADLPGHEDGAHPGSAGQA